MKKVSVIIVNYNVIHFLEQTIKSVQNAMLNIDAEIIVVDNNSVDGSVTMMKESFPDITLIENKKNTGFATANNQGIKIAKGKYILLLNPDTIIEETTLTKCAQFMDDHQDAGALGVKMVDGKGVFLPESKRSLPSPWVAFYKVFGLAALFPKSKKFGKYHLSYLDKDKTHEIEILSGAFMFIRKKTLDKVGVLDEKYFMYGEDIDLSYRITQGGYKNYYFPETTIIHYKGESTKKTSVNYVFVFYKAMVIFAKQHFSNKANAGIFSVLIHTAIYLRAVIALVNRIIFKITLPLLDAGIIYIGYYFIKNYWEQNHKYAPTLYPSIYMDLVVPIYILVWIVSSYFSGGYDKPYKGAKIIRGAIIGTIIISATSNFFDAYRFSKALIILGGAWVSVAMIANRFVYHFIRYKNMRLGQESFKRVAIVGSREESKRIINLLSKNQSNLESVGYITLKSSSSTENYLGHIEQISEIVEIYNIEEIIFCSKDIPANKIIEWMTKIDNSNVDYKIVPHESDYIIGSSSKNTQGDLYTLDITLNLTSKNNLRNKRVLDVSLSLIFLSLSPIIMWFTKKPFRFIGNIFIVLVGKKSWVGFENNTEINLPSIKKGVISPSSNLAPEHINENAIRRLDLLYAKDYSTSFDLDLILRSFRKLG